MVSVHIGLYQSVRRAKDSQHFTLQMEFTSSAVQQTAYLEALDRYIDVDENDNIRRCLTDENGNRLKDAEGNP